MQVHGQCIDAKPSLGFGGVVLELTVNRLDLLLLPLHICFEDYVDLHAMKATLLQIQNWPEHCQRHRCRMQLISSCRICISKRIGCIATIGHTFSHLDPHAQASQKLQPHWQLEGL